MASTVTGAATSTATLGPYHPERRAREAPEHSAVVMAGTGTTVTYRQLADRSGQLAAALRRSRITSGDRVAILAENHPQLFEVCWAALRSGLYATPIPTSLTVDEAAYIVDDAGSAVLVATASQGELAGELARIATTVRVRLSIGGPLDGFEPYEVAIAGQPTGPHPDEPEGAMMFYSSGTTGRPKGIQRPLSGRPAGSTFPLAPFQPHVGLAGDTVYLSAGPLYHAALLGWSLGVQRAGGTVVVLERFDAEAALLAIERYRVTHAQFVPTMLIRMLRLPEPRRRAYDLSSLRKVIHAAAPCPPDVKEAMVGWLGPIVDEYYSGSEGSGITYITSREWSEHRGSVGRPILGEVSITDDDGRPLAPFETGTIWFRGGERYEYRGDAAATASKRDRRGWTTLDDVGYLDDDGYLYLTDRRSHMIVSGGVNIYPQETENVLALHPRVDDVAVIGVPDPEFGEEVKAVVVATAGERDDALARELIEYCRERLAHHKCPRSVDFVEELPRLATGKLAKHKLKDRYWAGRATRVL
jgi:long-chain acyl-CoA synthetase